jgi:hypothetical protein
MLPPFALRAAVALNGAAQPWADPHAAGARQKATQRRASPLRGYPRGIRVASKPCNPSTLMDHAQYTHNSRPAESGAASTPVSGSGMIGLPHLSHDR